MCLATAHDPSANGHAAPEAALSAAPLCYRQSDSFVALLRELRSSLLVSTGQANKLLVVRAADDGLSTLVRSFDRPMGMAVGGGGLALGTRLGIWLFRSAADIAAQVEPEGSHDGCFLPRSCHVTGDIAVPEMGWGRHSLSPVSRNGGGGSAGEEALWIVNTRFSCLCTLHLDFSFMPRWQPPFVSALAAEDRCHLNGIALTRSADGARAPRFATALGETDAPRGWREHKAKGGCLMDIPSGEVLARGLCLPHSPRWHDDRLYLLESGAGRLVFLDSARGSCQTICELPGFTRGLALAGPYAFIGLSKIRRTSVTDGVPLAERRAELLAGVAVVDLRRGVPVGMLELETGVEEIFDVQLLGVRFPAVLDFQKDEVDAEKRPGGQNSA